jgi:ubiquitin C-terminal hydrolase
MNDNNNNMNMNNNMNNINNMNNNMNMNKNMNMNNINNMNNMNNNLNNINNNPPDLNSFARFTKATNTGLTNQGNTSYLNAVLQLIGSIRNFASYFTKEKNKQYFLNNVGNCPLAFVTHRLFLHLYKYPENQERETYTPDSYLKVLQMKNLTYKTGKNRNPNDLLTFILDGLHSELNQLKNNNIITPKNTSDKDNVCKCGIMDFQNRHKSVVSNLFNWFQLKEASCGACNNTTCSFHTYNTFDLDILGCSRNNNFININNCLTYNSLGRPKKAYCNNCRKFTQMMSSSKIYSSPNTFIFLLNRGNMDQNLMNIRFQLEEKINIKKFIENQDAPSFYELNGIVSIDLKNHKYVSFCMSPVDKNWYYYNDEDIQPTNINNVIQLHNNGGYIPCILLYHSRQ